MEPAPTAWLSQKERGTSILLGTEAAVLPARRSSRLGLRGGHGCSRPARGRAASAQASVPRPSVPYPCPEKAQLAGKTSTRRRIGLPLGTDERCCACVLTSAHGTPKGGRPWRQSIPRGHHSAPVRCPEWSPRSCRLAGTLTKAPSSISLGSVQTSDAFPIRCTGWDSKGAGRVVL
jgi:hypothetical protein